MASPALTAIKDLHVPEMLERTMACVRSCFRSELGQPDPLQDALAKIERLQAQGSAERASIMRLVEANEGLLAALKKARNFILLPYSGDPGPEREMLREIDALTSEQKADESSGYDKTKDRYYEPNQGSD